MSKRTETINLYPGKEILLQKEGVVRVYTVEKLTPDFVICNVDNRYNETFRYRDLQEIKEGRNKDYEWIA